MLGTPKNENLILTKSLYSEILITLWILDSLNVMFMF